MIDITVDFETCACCPTAAVMSVGAVAWNRDAMDTPFLPEDEECTAPDTEFMAHVDLRGMFIDGFTFDPKTARWWDAQSVDAKRAVLDSDGEGSPCRPIEEVIKDLFAWVDEVKFFYQSEEVYLWSQGTDFDIAILRTICTKYGISIPCKYANFRDHRTYFLEGYRLVCDIAGMPFDVSKAYTLVDDYGEPGVVHDPVFDCKRSIYSTWQTMKHLQCLGTKKKV